MWEEEPPPLRSSPLHFPLPAAAEAAKALDEEVASLLSKGAVSVVENPASPGFYGRLFLVPKASGGFRPVLDLSSLNEFLKQEHFKMETPSSIRESVRQGDWACKVDLADAYFHISIAPAHRKFLRFTHRGQVLQFNRLAFGLSLAPWLFTKVVREFASALRDKGIRLRAYLDDWAVLNQSQSLCESQTTEVVSLAQSLGFQVNWEKSDLVPKQVFDFLGMRFNTISFVVCPTAERLTKLAQLLQSLLRKSSASARSLSSLLGSMESLAPLLPLGRLHKRPFQREFRRRWSQALMPWDQVIPLGQWFSDSTEVWRDPSFISRVVPISPPRPAMTLFSDASTLGWGAHLLHLTASGKWSDEQRSWHINRLELEAVFLALRQFLPTVQGKAVLVATDNTTVSCYIKKQGGGALLEPLGEGRADAAVLPGARHHPFLPAHSRETQRPSGCAQQVGPSDPNRVDALPQGPNLGLVSVPQTSLGPVCNPLLEEAPNLCQPGAGPGGPSGRRSLPGLVGVGGLCLPPLYL